MSDTVNNNNENQVINEVTEEQQALPEVQAAQYLVTALPAFRTRLDNLTGTQAKRVLSALIEAPLEQETPTFSTQEAHNLYMLGLYITNAKHILFTAAIKDQKITEEAIANSEKEMSEAAS